MHAQQEKKIGAAWMTASLVVCATSAPAGGIAYDVDPGASSASVHVGKTGLGSFAGHEHEITVGRIRGEVLADLDDNARSSVELIIEAASLRVGDEPGDDGPKVQRTMQGRAVLDVARFPRIRFRSSAVSGKTLSAGLHQLTVQGELTLHGVAKSISVPVRLETQAGALTATGQLGVKQSDFGIEPTTAGGGLVKVADEVAVSFRVVARRR